MRKKMYRLSLALFLLLLTCLAVPQATAADSAPVIWENRQNYVQSGRIIVAADPRLFTAMALFNCVYDYDDENAPAMYPLRAKVRAELDRRLRDVPAEKIAQWKKVKKDVHIYQYVFYVMSLSGEYPFHRVLPHPGGWWAGVLDYLFGLRGFEKTMNDFWETMQLATLWQEIYPEYIAEVNRFSMERINREEDLIWEYVRMPRNKTGKYLVSIPNLMDSQWSAFSVEYRDYFFTVSSPGSHDYGLNIHEYLHGVLGPVVEQSYAAYRDKFRPYLDAVRKMPVIGNNYNSLEGFIEENLVRAMDHRIRVVNGLSDTASTLSQIDDQTGEGFNLLLPFYQLLQEYENSSDCGFDRYVTQIFDHIPDFAAQR